MSPQNRSFRYGDGLFETIIYRKNKIKFFKDHLRRLKNGMKALAFEGITGLKKDLLEQQILRLIAKNRLHGKVRVKIQVWRKPGGLYLPENNHFNILITAEEEAESFEFKSLKLAFSEQVKLAYSSISKYKTSNALPYVIAAIEKQKRGYDDLVLCDTRDRISECIASNIFWVKNDQVFTPSLKTGCVAGIARKNLIRKLEKLGTKVKIVKEKKDKLIDADSIFLSNVSGIIHVQYLEKVHYK
ncbi:MAG: aminotransferase class IV, partial [Bacteroidota bacterium]